VGCDSFDDYRHRSRFYGCTVGRYANRICGGKFSLNGREYDLEKNNNGNALHGGKIGWDKKVWKIEAAHWDAEGCPFVEFSHVSEDGDEGYPAKLTISVKFTLTQDNEVKIKYYVKNEDAEKSTVINMTNHAYFNLAGEGDILNHEIKVAEKLDPKSIKSIENSFLKLQNTFFLLNHKHFAIQNLKIRLKRTTSHQSMMWQFRMDASST